MPDSDPMSDVVGHMVHGDPMCDVCWRERDGGEPVTGEDAHETDMRCSVCDSRMWEW